MLGVLKSALLLTDGPRQSAEPPFDLLTAPNQRARWWPGVGMQTYGVANFPNSGDGYLSTSNSSWLNGLAAFTFAATFQVDVDNDGADRALISQWDDVSGLQNCFAVYIKGGDGNAVEVDVATALNEAIFATRVLSHVDVSAGAEMQVPWHVTIVYDGSLVGNTSRVKIYHLGVRDTGTTSTGTIPAALLASSAPLKIGKGGLSGSCWRGPLAACRWWNRALTDAEVLAVANPQANGNPVHLSLTDLAALGLSPDHAWELGETSDGTAPVTRRDSIGSIDLTDATNVPSKLVSEWADQSGMGNHAISTLPDTSTDPPHAPLIVAEANGMQSWNYRISPFSACAFHCRKLGYTDNPPQHTIYTLVWINSGHPVAFWGSDAYLGADGNNLSTNSWAYVEGDDFAVIGVGPGILCTAYGNGLGVLPENYTDFSKNGVAAAYSTPGSRPDQQWVVIAQQFIPGDNAERLWLNGVSLPLTVISDTYPDPFSDKITTNGGPMQGWRIGQLGNWDQSNYAACFGGRIAAQVIFDAIHSPSQIAAASAQLLAMAPTTAQDSTLMKGASEIHFWRLDEASSLNRQDQIGTLALVNTNGATLTTVGGHPATSFVGASSQSLIIGGTTVQPGPIFTFAGFVSFGAAAMGANADFISKDSSATGYDLRKDTNDKLLLLIRQSNGSDCVRLEHGTVLTVNTEYFFVMGYDGTNGFIWLNADTSNKVTQAGAGAGPNVDSTETFFMGSGAAGPTTCTLRNVGFWKGKVLTAAEATALYAAGAGKQPVNGLFV